MKKGETLAVVQFTFHKSSIPHGLIRSELSFKPHPLNHPRRPPPRVPGSHPLSLSPPPPRHPSLSPSSSPQRHSLSRPCGSQSTHRHVALTGTLHQGARRLRRRCFFPWRRARQCHLVLVTSYRRRLHHLVAGCRLFSVGYPQRPRSTVDTESSLPIVGTRRGQILGARGGGGGHVPAPMRTRCHP
ncbi:uncharacterized protein LOC110272098 [Arachis ipaensis]|uniref:uncharacterized protein LOC110272098 n=1 Tax=Arachis ipaensis TaxID=130454 RepID=UPI000A2B9844|nr:uncharacterized protein LOC110272098 [Arachis ipaensis]